MPTKKSLKQEIMDKITEKLTEKLQDMANQKVEDALKQYQDTEMKDTETTK
jgi:cation transport regulator ChaB